jgi:hypothetical protein
MKTYITEFTAIDQGDGTLKKYAGQNIEAISWAQAEAICLLQYPWLKVVGRLHYIIDTEGTHHYNFHAN